MIANVKDSLPIESNTVLPYIILWDPVKKFPELITECIGDGCTGKLSVQFWRVGQSHSMEPRLLHCVENTVMLISPTYQCEYGHTLSATDPQLIGKLNPAYVPFILLHHSGFTRHFVNTLFREGVSILGIEHHILSN